MIATCEYCGKTNSHIYAKRICASCYRNHRQEYKEMLEKRANLPNFKNCNMRIRYDEI